MYYAPKETAIQSGQHLLRAIAEAVRKVCPDESFSLVLNGDGSGQIISTPALPPDQVAEAPARIRCGWAEDEDSTIVILSWIGRLVNEEHELEW
jgi:hypothetical protein